MSGNHRSNKGDFSSYRGRDSDRSNRNYDSRSQSGNHYSNRSNFSYRDRDRSRDYDDSRSQGDNHRSDRGQDRDRRKRDYDDSRSQGEKSNLSKKKRLSIRDDILQSQEKNKLLDLVVKKDYAGIKLQLEEYFNNLSLSNIKVDLSKYVLKELLLKLNEIQISDVLSELVKWIVQYNYQNKNNLDSDFFCSALNISKEIASYELANEIRKHAEKLELFNSQMLGIFLNIAIYLKHFQEGADAFECYFLLDINVGDTSTNKERQRDLSIPVKYKEMTIKLISSYLTCCSQVQKLEKFQQFFEEVIYKENLFSYSIIRSTTHTFFYLCADLVAKGELNKDNFDKIFSFIVKKNSCIGKRNVQLKMIYGVYLQCYINCFNTLENEAFIEEIFLKAVDLQIANDFIFKMMIKWAIDTENSKRVIDYYQKAIAIKIDLNEIENLYNNFIKMQDLKKEASSLGILKEAISNTDDSNQAITVIVNSKQTPIQAILPQQNNVVEVVDHPISDVTEIINDDHTNRMVNLGQAIDPTTPQDLNPFASYADELRFNKNYWDEYDTNRLSSFNIESYLNDAWVLNFDNNQGADITKTINNNPINGIDNHDQIFEVDHINLAQTNKFGDLFSSPQTTNSAPPVASLIPAPGTRLRTF